jgi:iron complex outermembrane recepter protein
MHANVVSGGLVGFAIKFTARLALACAAALACVHVASAQQAASTAADANSSASLAEIVVTAEKRTENLQQVPVAVAVMNSDQLQMRGIESVANLMQGDIPSVKVEPFAGNQSVLEVGIRGFINPNGTDITNENPVPTYVDGVYYGRQTSIALELNDLERMEVLRGPQGTLFGKNAEGGAIQLISKDPTGEFGVDARGEGGNYGYWKGVLHVDLPAIGIMSAKIDGLSTGNNGWTTNPAESQGQYNYGVTDSNAGKLTLLFKFSDTFRAEMAGDYTVLKTSEYWNAQLAYDPVGSPWNSVWPNQLRTPLSEPWDTYRPLDPQTYWGDRLNLEWTPSDALTVKSITALRSDKDTLYNTAATSSVLPGPFLLPAGACPAAGPLCTSLIIDPIPEYIQTHRQFSQEFQFIGHSDHFDWVGGLFYIKETSEETEPTYFGAILPNSIPPAYPYLPATPTTSALITPLLGPVSLAGANVEQSSKAVFGQVTYHFDDKLSFDLGARYSHDDKSALRAAGEGDVYVAPTYPAFPNGPIAPGLPCPQSPQCSPSVVHNQASPLAAVKYAFTPDVLGYFRFSTGYQGPGLSVGSQTFRYTEPSTVDSYELGVKSEFAQHTVRVNLAAYYENWKQPQENIQTTSSSTVEFFNGPQIQIEGLELDSSYQPMAGLTFDWSAAIQTGRQAAVTNPFPPPAGFPPVSPEFHLEALPHWATSLGVVDDLVHTDYGVLRLNVQVNGTASYYSVPNVSIPVASYWLTNARLTFAGIPLGGGKLDVALWGNNLFNRSYTQFVYQTPGPDTFGAYGPPRMYGGTVQYRFK